jgi:hypothetical protein
MATATPDGAWNSAPKITDPELYDLKRLTAKSGIPGYTIRDMRLNGTLIVPAHCVRVNRKFYYRWWLIQDGLACGFDSTAHKNAIQNFLEGLPSNRSEKIGRGRPRRAAA